MVFQPLYNPPYYDISRNDNVKPGCVVKISHIFFATSLFSLLKKFVLCFDRPHQKSSFYTCLCRSFMPSIKQGKGESNRQKKNLFFTTITTTDKKISFSVLVRESNLKTIYYHLVKSLFRVTCVGKTAVFFICKFYEQHVKKNKVFFLSRFSCFTSQKENVFSRKSLVFFSHREKASFLKVKASQTWLPKKLEKKQNFFITGPFAKQSLERLEKSKLKTYSRLGMKKQYNVRSNTILQDIFSDDRTNLHDNNSYAKKSSSINLNKYYLCKRNNTLIFDRKSLFNYFTTAIHIFIYVLRMKGNILIINTNPELSKLAYHIKKSIHNHNFKLFENNIFFSDCGWTNGTLTNSNKVFNKVKTFINFYVNYNTFLNENNIIFPAYTKMKKNYKGFIPNPNSYNKQLSSSLDTGSFFNRNFKPDLIVFLSITNCKSIIKEANSLNIPIMGFVDNNSPINNIQYPIFGNPNSYLLIWFFFTLITKITNYPIARKKNVVF